jgi:acetyl-CoA/propionyl-CoA carboxylase biotin carboxyl carrier protein
MRQRIGRIAKEAARAVGYRSAGTVEGLQTDGEYFFLEMNTRVQVEHCVTEMVTGVDIVREQVLIAAGEELSVSQDEVEMRGHAIECRINAEAAHKKFAPAPGRIAAYREPAGPGVRVDSGVEAGTEVTPLYDPMIAKLIVWDTDRERATARMLRALGEYEIEGLTTLVPFHRALLATDQWRRGETCRDLLEDRDWLKGLAPEKPASANGAGADEGEEEGEPVERDYRVEVSGRLYDVKVIAPPNPGPASNNSGGPAGALRRPPRREAAAGGGTAVATTDLVAPLQGTILKVAVEKGQDVEEGALVCVIEAMKMENEVVAHRSGKVSELRASEGAAVSGGDVIAVIE